MKTLKLKKINLEVMEILPRTQLKTIFGGYACGAQSCSGALDCTNHACPTCDRTYGYCVE